MHKHYRPSAGFTIVELLIVIVVIAILAAISVVAYTGIQGRARTAAHQHAASQTEREIMTYALQANGESISLGGTLVGYKEGAGDILLLKPLTGTPNITMYVVYSVASTASSYPTIAALTPVIGSYHRLQLNTGPPGSDQMSSRIDTSAQTNVTGLVNGVRVPGNTIAGWLQVSSNGTARAFGYNQAAANGSGTLSSHAGWNFTELSSFDNDGMSQVALVFNATHDQATRAQVLSWLANKYGVSL